ncbi:MAG: valine--tRNA ligase [Candidatus Paceibacterota bacterium]|jgi:valyl-tRNA synthetase
MLNNDSKFLKPYNPSETEKRIYERWEKSGYFNPDNLPQTDKGAFTIIMPPPNANGRLHAGHALFVTLEDVMTRYKRLRGYKTLWLPGTDHAGFETQVVFEKKLEKEGKSRFDFSPEELYGEIMKFTQDNKSATETDLRALGSSCDWSREKFTLDPDIIQTVYATFKQMSDDGLIYRGKRIVNWCTKHQTSLSDLETTPVTQTDKLYYMKYGPFTIATSRPETKFGDKYVVMHPDDPRYAEYKEGQQIPVDWLEGKITATVVKDSVIDMEFGTGVMTITPWHDTADFEIAERHNLTGVEVIDKNGRLTSAAGKYEGLKIEEARKKVVEDLKTLGLMEKEEDYEHTINTCYKCNRTLEPRVMPQWFVKMEPLAKKAIEVVKSGEVKIIPDFQEKIYFHWLENIRDWNISRQIVWGIPIPAKICTNPLCDYGVVYPVEYSEQLDRVNLDNKETKCKKCGAELVKDPDTFDTWFSSGQWPFATLGYPDNPDFKTFYPTDVMETAADILFFWVAKMIMLGIYRTGKIPFHTIYLHGMVRDGSRQKMSKSKGNVISPVEIGEKYGTDALRMALVVGNTPGTDMALSEDKIKAYKLFANKLWNVARFILSNADFKQYDASFNKYTETDQKLREIRHNLIVDITTDFDNFRFHLASDKLYHYVWDELAANILEDSKKIFAGSDGPTRTSRQQFLLHTLKKILITLHPFMPFITEEIWQELGSNSLLMIESWPVE